MRFAKKFYLIAFRVRHVNVILWPGGPWIVGHRRKVGKVWIFCIKKYYSSWLLPFLLSTIHDHLARCVIACREDM